MRSALRSRLLGAASVLVATLALAGCSAQPGPATASATATDAPTHAITATSSPTASATPTPTAQAGRPTVIAALGDSLSTGFDACDHYGDCPAASWITGTDPTVNSIATRTRQVTGVRPTVHNDARAGVSVDDLARQVDLAIGQQPDLVTVLIGGNDVCRAKVADMTSPRVYATTVDAQITRLATALPDARILVASVPDVTDLRPVASSNATARFLWTTLGGCRTVLGDPQSTSLATQTRLADVQERIDSYNSALATTCAAFDRCVWDGGELNRYQPTIAQLSPLDYFHPSIAGLREIADNEWAALQAG